ncbi:MAG: leucine--tRNA ligase [Chloroflexi bacterium]|nr:leucine--tRNA ligase [Chloroflexota bacterium]
MPPEYIPTEIEKKWQERWAADHLYEVEESDPRPKWYALTMFPYTSGDLHIGHWYAMAPSDVHARFKRMQGYKVLHPMGFDAFGLPAENAAIKRGIQPRKWTMDNVENMRRQLKSIGAVYDWRREAITCVPEYYRWTQWLFLQLYKGGLAYRAKAPANWCPSCQTVLANEQVKDGQCERCDTPVTHRDLEQWFLRITNYAEELLRHDGIEWPERIKIMQRNWIGRSEGAELSFDISHLGLPEKDLRVFTTRPDTVYGVTFMVLAPEHPLVPALTAPQRRAEVEAYVESARRETEIQRLSTEREKTGVALGTEAVVPFNGRRVPLLIADYVLLGYGTGVVMGVPAHDQRDFDFAKKYGLPIPIVIAPPDWNGKDLTEAYVAEGTMVNSGPFEGTPSEQGKAAVAEYAQQKGWGGPKVSYRLRDWLISRQRYWGAPIPIVYCPHCGTVPVPETELPVLLPDEAEFKPTGESPLKYVQGFVSTRCPQCGHPAQRETDTMDTFICSSWYFLRYTSPGYDKGAWDPERMHHWMPVDQYTGGAEHATMHLLYARFFTKALRDLGLVSCDEPFLRLFNQGTIVLGHHKMSKSRGNVVTPDVYVGEHGADAVRMYLMFLGPWEHGGEWNDAGLNGVVRWLNRVWRLALEDSSVLGSVVSSEEARRALLRVTHQTIRRVTQDLETFQFNTMVAALMEFTNYLGQVWQDRTADKELWHFARDTLLLLLAPSTPHLAEELWVRTGHTYSIHSQPFPTWDDTLAAEEQITLVIQVNGRLRDRVTVPASIPEARAKELALSQEKVQPHVAGKQVEKVVYVPGRLVNIVVR